MELEDLKKQWHKAHIDSSDLVSTDRRLANNLEKGKAKSLQHKLAHTYRVNAFFGFLMIILSPALFYLVQLPLWLALLYGIIGALFAVIYTVFSNKIKNTEYIGLNTLDALKEIAKIARIRLTLMVFGSISIGVILGAMFILLKLRSDIDLIYGMTVGLVIGLCIDIVRWRRTNTLICSLKEAISKLNDDK